MTEYRDRYEHHLVLRVENNSKAQTERFLKEYFTVHQSGSYFVCSEEEGLAYVLTPFCDCRGRQFVIVIRTVVKLKIL